MSIETTLTWGVALGLLFTALVVRTIALGLYRLGRFAWVRLSGEPAVRRQEDVREALPAIPLSERLAHAADGVAAAGIFVAATIARWVELVGRGLAWMFTRIGRGAAAAWAWSAPRIRDGFAWLSPRVAAGTRATLRGIGVGARASARGLIVAWVWLVSAVSTFARRLRSSSYPGSQRKQAPGLVRTYPTPQAQLARARANSGTRAGAA